MISHLVCNLDFEEELVGRDAYRPSAAVLERCKRWSTIMRLLPAAREGKAIELTTGGPLVLPNEKVTAALFWGVTLQTLAWSQTHGLPTLPSVELVAAVNDKGWSHRLEHEWGIALPGSALVREVEDLERLVAACPADWVLKHPLGFSGRQRVFGKPGLLSSSALGWARRQIEAGWTLVFEPWVSDRQDFSVHFEIEASGQVRFFGFCELCNSSNGVYRGNRFSPEWTLDEEIKKGSYAAAERVASLGYWGPVSVDALTGTLAGQAIVRPLVEINARYSFGRLALEIRSLVPPGWSYFWWHPPEAEFEMVKDQLRDFPESSSAVTAGWFRLPRWADPGNASKTVLLLAPSLEALEELWAACDNHDHQQSRSVTP